MMDESDRHLTIILNAEFFGDLIDQIRRWKPEDMGAHFLGGYFASAIRAAADKHRLGWRDYSRERG